MTKDFSIYYQIGQKIKKFRKIAKFSQKELASNLGVSFQQLQKYESGENRITADKLWKVSCFLEMDINNFFDKNTDTFEESKIKTNEEKLKKTIVDFVNNL